MLWRGGIAAEQVATAEPFAQRLSWAIQAQNERPGNGRLSMSLCFQILGLIDTGLKAGILEWDGTVLHPQTGTLQGDVVSPIWANERRSQFRNRKTS